ncbi:transcriptional regulator, AlpA family [Noviherbaspirillum humi]|uniref:Transcriptional regulator, AlpA family n=1 Tax=Noviherbaspirillum humi TaxID=1688639 RepID=A0A239LE40_9BURK|nr:AlpA family transcriptional regulator [Noviherbaspirillum humi]SNT28580.1 transcriptional regulator, AlpA family [Noviherbaspirillum humi]
MNHRVLKLQEVMAKVGMKKTSIYRAISVHDFPAPISLGAQAVGWVEAEIDAWIESRMQARQVYKFGLDLTGHVG